jgi:hypothetical protein
MAANQAKTGSNSNIVVAKATTWGTAVAGGANSKLIGFSVTPKRGTETLQGNPIGTGLDMIDEVDMGAVKPSLSFADGDERFDGAGQILEAAFFGADSVVSLGSGAYGHSFFRNQAQDQYISVGLDACVGSILEYSTVQLSKLTSSWKIGEYVKKTLEGIASDEKTTGTTNTYASLAAATAPSTKKAVFQTSDKFRINGQTGAALGAGDILPILSAEVSFTEELDHALEANGVAANGTPLKTGTPPFGGTVTVTLSRQDSHKWRETLSSGAEMKADLSCVHSTFAGGAINRSITYFFPRLKLVTDIDWALANAADNNVTLTYTMLAATGAAPSGMGSTLPYKYVVNSTSTSLI